MTTRDLCTLPRGVLGLRPEFRPGKWVIGCLEARNLPVGPKGRHGYTHQWTHHTHSVIRWLTNAGALAVQTQTAEAGYWDM